jgi:hypothetical protein
VTATSSATGPSPRAASFSHDLGETEGKIDGSPGALGRVKRLTRAGLVGIIKTATVVVGLSVGVTLGPVVGGLLSEVGLTP